MRILEDINLIITENIPLINLSFIVFNTAVLFLSLKEMVGKINCILYKCYKHTANIHVLYTKTHLYIREFNALLQ